NRNNVKLMAPRYPFEIFFDLLMFSIKHHNVYPCVQALQQMTGSLPVANMATQQNSTFASAYNFPEIFFTIKVVCEFVIDPSHHNHFVQKSLARNVIVVINTGDRFQPVVVMAVTEIAVNMAACFPGKHKVVERDEAQSQIGNVYAKITDDKHKNTVTQTSTFGFTLPLGQFKSELSFLPVRSRNRRRTETY